MQSYFASTPSQQGYPTGIPPLVHAGSATSSTIDVWNQQALLAALVTSGVPPSGPQATKWFLDTGATSHMASNANVGNFQSCLPLPNSPLITVSNGAMMPVTHQAASTIATPRSSLNLNNILVSPSLVKNLISVRSFAHS
jgi:hypothetical protein